MRPRTRGDCLPGGSNAQRPCPYVSCRHHLAVDVTNDAHGRPVVAYVRRGWELVDRAVLHPDAPTCALDLVRPEGMERAEVHRALDFAMHRAELGKVERRALESCPPAVAEYIVNHPKRAR